MSKPIKRTAAAWSRLPATGWGASILSVASLVWTTYSIAGLVNSWWATATVAVTADLTWAFVIWAEYKGYTILGHKWIVAVVGWLFLSFVIVLLVAHGIHVNNNAMAWSSPLLPLGAKFLWLLTVDAAKPQPDPTGLTPEQQAEIDGMLRTARYEAGKISAVSEQEEMRAKAQLHEIEISGQIAAKRADVEFTSTLLRMEKANELVQRMPVMVMAMVAAANGGGFMDGFTLAASDATVEAELVDDADADTRPAPGEATIDATASTGEAATPPDATLGVEQMNEADPADAVTPPTPEVVLTGVGSEAPVTPVPTPSDVFGKQVKLSFGFTADAGVKSSQVSHDAARNVRSVSSNISMKPTAPAMTPDGVNDFIPAQARDADPTPTGVSDAHHDAGDADAPDPAIVLTASLASAASPAEAVKLALDAGFTTADAVKLVCDARPGVNRKSVVQAARRINR